jgi:hypothetical protein
MDSVGKEKMPFPSVSMVTGGERRNPNPQFRRGLDAETGSPSGCLSYKTKMITRKRINQKKSSSAFS